MYNGQDGTGLSADPGAQLWVPEIVRGDMLITLCQFGVKGLHGEPQQT